MAAVGIACYEMRVANREVKQHHSCLEHSPV